MNHPNRQVFECAAGDVRLNRFDKARQGCVERAVTLRVVGRVFVLLQKHRLFRMVGVETEGVVPQPFKPF